MQNVMRPFAPVLLAAVLVSFAAHAQDDAGELDQWYRDLAGTGDSDRPAARASSNWRGLVGAGVLVAQRAHGDTRAAPFPLASISYKDIAYWRMTGGGVWLLTSDDRRARVGIAGKFRRGYDPDDADGLAGMTPRDPSFEAGVNAVWATRPLILSAAYYADVSGRSDGESALVRVAHAFRVSPRLRVVPSIGAEWLDADVVDYYYGVHPDEATATRPAYTGKAATNLRAGVATHFALTRAWSLFGGVSYTRLGAGIADSPIVVNDDVTALHVGGGWRF